VDRPLDAARPHGRCDVLDRPDLLRAREPGVVRRAEAAGPAGCPARRAAADRLRDAVAQHFSGRSIVGHGRRLWAGWVIEGPTRRFYHAGDSGYFDGFRALRERFGRIDVAALPIGAYEPAEIMRFVHLDPEEAVRAALDLEARYTVAMHWGTFDLTDEPPDEPPRRFRAAAEAANLGPDRAWVLAVGETRRW